MKNHGIIAVAGLALSVLAPTSSQAMNEIYDPSVSTCSTLNCSSVIFGASILAFGSDPTRWEANVYAFNGECLRLDVTAMGAGADDEIVVVSPNGTTYRNDDFGGALRPRVAFIAPQRGWYHVSIGRYNGLASPEHNFTLAYGRYVGAGNPNCGTPTAGQAASASAALKPAVGNAAGDNLGPNAPGGR